MQNLTRERHLVQTEKMGPAGFEPATSRFLKMFGAPPSKMRLKGTYKASAPSPEPRAQIVAPLGFEPRSTGPKPAMLVRYTTGLQLYKLLYVLRGCFLKKFSYLENLKPKQWIRERKRTLLEA